MKKPKRVWDRRTSVYSSRTYNKNVKLLVWCHSVEYAEEIAKSGKKAWYWTLEGANGQWSKTGEALTEVEARADAERAAKVSIGAT